MGILCEEVVFSATPKIIRKPWINSKNSEVSYLKIYNSLLLNSTVEYLDDIIYIVQFTIIWEILFV